MLRIRNAIASDFERIMEIYEFAQDYMIRSGNPTQWGHFYPDPALIRSDICRNVCKVIFDESGIHGVFALFDGADDAPYLTIHRIAGDGQVHDLFRCAADYCKAISQNVRIDTHADNQTMRKLIEKNGFTRCGIIHVKDGTPRIAYQWTAA